MQYKIVYATNFFQLSIDYLFKQHSANYVIPSMAGQGYTVKTRLTQPSSHRVYSIMGDKGIKLNHMEINK